jgi:DNA-binding SARP family transcriptional activator
VLPVATSDRHRLAGPGDSSRPAVIPFRLALLEGFELTQGGVSIPLSQGPQHLLAYLALHERSLPRIRVAGMLWPDVADGRAAGNLRSALWRLRAAGLNLVGSRRDLLSLSAQVVVDIRDANRMATLIVDPETDVAALRFEELPFSGELLPGWYDDWILLEREHQREICLQSLEVLCERWTDTGHYAKAVMAGLAAVAQEPLRESANRVLIRAYLANGNAGDARRQYLRYREILWAELHLEPSWLMMQLAIR